MCFSCAYFCATEEYSNLVTSGASESGKLRRHQYMNRKVAEMQHRMRLYLEKSHIYNHTLSSRVRQCLSTAALATREHASFHTACNQFRAHINRCTHTSVVYRRDSLSEDIHAIGNPTHTCVFTALFCIIEDTCNWQSHPYMCLYRAILHHRRYMQLAIPPIHVSLPRYSTS